jgi:hypothetical protein
MSQSIPEALMPIVEGEDYLGWVLLSGMMGRSQICVTISIKTLYQPVHELLPKLKGQNFADNFPIGKCASAKLAKFAISHHHLHGSAV